MWQIQVRRISFEAKRDESCQPLDALIAPNIPLSDRKKRLFSMSVSREGVSEDLEHMEG